MINRKKLHPIGRSMQPARKRIRSLRIIIVIVGLVVITVGLALSSGFLTKVSAAIQNAAKRTVTPAPKSPKSTKPTPTARQAKEAEVGSQSQTKPDGSITPG